MSDITFRSEKTIEKQSKPTKPQEGEKQDTYAQQKVDVEMPYLDRQKPFVVEHFDLGGQYKQTYADEIDTIENYLREEIEGGRLENSTEAVKQVIKEAEKVSGSSKKDRMIVRLGILSEYLKFLAKTRDIKGFSQKYGSTRQK